MPRPKLHRTDENHAEIKRAFEALGCSVISLAEVGGGCPDLLVGVVGVNLLVEVKTEAGTLTPAQRVFRRDWRGQGAEVRTVDDVHRLVQRVRAGQWALRAGGA